MKRKLVGMNALAFAITLAFSGAAYSQQIVYDSLPPDGTPNIPSLGVEAYSMPEIGDQIRLAPGTRTLASVTITMSSWACESGSWNLGNCVTTLDAKFQHPVTLNIYALNADNPMLPGSQIATKTASFNMPFRPSADPTCSNTTQWRAENGSCYNGYAFDITFSMSDLNVTLPEEFVWGIAYNTSHRGYFPLGGPGGPYDSLNVGLNSAATVGVDVDPDAIFWNTSVTGWYCDGGAAGSGIFRNDNGAGCWTGYVPAARFTTSLPSPSDSSQCKRGGWLNLYRADGTAFKNQGDCVSYVEAGK